MPLSPKRNADALEPVHHGGLRYDELERRGESPDAVLDFSVSVNPFPPPEVVWEALAKGDIVRYPDSMAGRLRRAVAERIGARDENVLMTHGVSEGIRLAPLAFADPGEESLIVCPTYGEYQAACKIMDTRIDLFWCEEARGFRMDADVLCRRIRQRRPKLVWLCNPDNPTGVYYAKQEVGDVLRECERSGALLILDEAYVGFVDSAWSSLEFTASEHCLLLRSLTKDYSVPGLRLGYVLAGADLIRTLTKVKPPWNIGGPAQAAGLALLENHGHFEASWRRLTALRECFRSELIGLGLEVLPSTTNFFLVKLKGKKQSVLRHLGDHGMQLRDCSSFGLADYVRVGTRLEVENRRLVGCLRGFLAA